MKYITKTLLQSDEFQTPVCYAHQLKLRVKAVILLSTVNLTKIAYMLNSLTTAKVYQSHSHYVVVNRSPALIMG